MYKQCQLIIEFTLSNHNHYLLRVPKPGVQIKDIILTKLRLEITLWYAGL